MRIPYQLPTQTFATNTRTVVNLKELPKVFNGQLLHLLKLQFDIYLEPTFGSGSVTNYNEHNIFNVEFNDGNGLTRFNGTFNAMRAKERMQTGRLRVPDPDEDATTVARYWTRTLHMGPPQMRSPEDFVIPTGALANAQLTFQHAALSLLGSTGSNVSAALGSLRITAWMVTLDEIRCPPAYQYVQEDTAAKSHQLTGRSRYESIAILNSSSYDAFSSGDLGSLRVDFGYGDIVPTIEAEALRAGFADDFAPGEIGGVIGEPEAASDDRSKVVNRSSGTAVAASPADLQPVLWTPPGGLLTKIPEAESVAKVGWNGSQSTATLLYGRLLEQTPNVIANIFSKAAREAGVAPGPTSVKTASKKEFRGTQRDMAFMPYKMRVGTAR